MTNYADIIGGTIDVPNGGTMDKLDISCRSDLTMDNVPGESAPPPHATSAPSLRPRLPARYARLRQRRLSREKSRGARESGMPLPTPSVPTLQRMPSHTSHSSFHTATNARGVEDADDADPQDEDGDDEGEEGERSDDGSHGVDDDDDDDLNDLDDLGKQAELAAMACFGTAADRLLDEGAPRKSALVSENSTIDVSWFASRGLMSRQSFERYQEEMKSKVIQGASSNNNLRSLDRRRRRFSLSMIDLRNEGWPGTKKGRKEAREEGGGAMKISHHSKTRRNRSVDQDLNSLVKSGSVDKLVRSIIRAVGDNKTQDASLIEPSPSKNIKNIGQLSKTNKAGSKSAPELNSDEIQVLTKMMRRLTNEDADQESSINADTLELTAWRHCTAEDLMDSSSCDNSPSPSDCHNLVSSDLNIQAAKSTIHLTSSTKSHKSSSTLKTGTATSMMTKGKNREMSNVYVPKRASSADIKETSAIERPSQMHDVDFPPSLELGTEEAFHTGNLERNDTLSINMILSGKEADDDESISTPSLPPIRNSAIDAAKFEQRDLADSLPPQRSLFGRSGEPILASKSTCEQLQQEERQDSGRSMQDSGSSMNMDFPMLKLERRSTTSVSTISAGATLDFTKDESILTNIDMPPLVEVDQSAKHPVERGLSTGTNCAVASACDEIAFPSNHDEIHFHKPRSVATFGADDFSPDNNARPQRRHSLSSHSSGGQKLLIRRNSFSSMFEAHDTLDGPPLKENCGDLLHEGQDYLSMAMLVNVYSKLRELSTLGHASVKLVDIDVNSHQSLSRKKERKRLGLSKTESDLYLDNTKTAGAIVRTVLDEYEMFEASNERSAMFGQVDRAAMMYDASLLSDFKTWVEESKVKQLDKVTEAVIKTLREECQKRQALMSSRSSNISLSNMEHAIDVRGSIARRRGSMIEKAGSSFQGALWLKQERTLIADHFGIRSDVPASETNCNTVDNSRRLSLGVLTESLLANTLDKAYDCFQEGSSLRNLLESGLEIVWFSDRHPSDITYCICINRETTTVTVIFRGQEGLVDLLKDSSSSKYPNPILHEDYEGNSEFINLRSAISDELMRIRRDNKKSTIDEIREKVDKIGKELTGGGPYHLSVTGHSLGGGLATVVGYYLASDPDLELASAVRIFAFATSRVGCEAFRQSFRHLESTGRLEHARFTNSNETVSLLPMQGAYHHVGMQICLHKPDSAGRQRIRRSLDVIYDGSVGRFGEAFRFVRNCLSAATSSRISEYQHRMHFAREYRLALSDCDLRFDKKRNHLKSLNDYYLMKCRLSEFMGISKGKESMSSFLLFFLASCLISFEIALLFKFVAPW